MRQMLLVVLSLVVIAAGCGGTSETTGPPDATHHSNCRAVCRAVVSDAA
jgi:hypothetical protein